MHLTKAIEQLRYLTENEPDDLNKYAKVHALLAGFKEENTEDGRMLDAYSDEKIAEVQIWFQMLCGVGEDGFGDAKLRQNLQSSIHGLERIVAPDGLTLHPPTAKLVRPDNEG